MGPQKLLMSVSSFTLKKCLALQGTKSALREFLSSSFTDGVVLMLNKTGSQQHQKLILSLYVLLEDTKCINIAPIY